MFDSIMKKIFDKSATVGIIGLGYVGLPLPYPLRAKG
jgi:UDP-N-acetyl-D-mannosaminuronate dehydrogenase